MYRYKTQYTCAREIQFEVDNTVITYLKFVGGCAGNTQGIASLVVGMKVEDVIAKTKGIQCRGGTSCPDQLSRALTEYQNKQN